VKSSAVVRSKPSRRESVREFSGPYPDAELSRRLTSLLGELATPLLSAGITPKCFGDLATIAFVNAACRASTLRNGRVNQSRVAVLTGLSRPEVRKLLADVRTARAVKQPRTKRVIDGWISDPSYVGEDGRPLSLPINGAGTSFASLARKFAGDVPHMAVLRELRRMNVVRESDKRVYLTGKAAQRSTMLLSALKSVLPVISDGVGLASAYAESATVPGIFRASMVASDTRDLAMMRERAMTGASWFLNGLRGSLDGSKRLARTTAKAKRQITVTVLVREHEFKKNPRRR
jgi:hypothetical protein